MSTAGVNRGVRSLLVKTLLTIPTIHLGLAGQRPTEDDDEDEDDEDEDALAMFPGDQTHSQKVPASST